MGITRNPISTNLMPHFFCYKISSLVRKKVLCGIMGISYLVNPQMFTGKSNVSRADIQFYIEYAFPRDENHCFFHDIRELI